MISTSGCAGLLTIPIFTDQHPKHYGLVITCGKAFRPGGIRPHWKYLNLATLKTSSPPPFNCNTITIKIISIIIMFTINTITFPNLWTPFSVASHLAHLDQTTVEAGHVFQTQASEKYLVIFIIIPIPDHLYIQWLVISFFCTACPSDSGFWEIIFNCPKDMCPSEKVSQKNVWF